MGEHHRRRIVARSRALLLAALCLAGTSACEPSDPASGPVVQRARKGVVQRFVQPPTPLVAEEIRAWRETEGRLLARLDLTDPAEREAWNVFVHDGQSHEGPGPLTVDQSAASLLWLESPVDLPLAFEVRVIAATPTPGPYFPSLLRWWRDEGSAFEWLPGQGKKDVRKRRILHWLRAPSTRSEEVEVQPGVRLTRARGYRVVDWQGAGPDFRLDFNPTGRQIDLASVELRVPLSTVDLERGPRAELWGTSMPSWIGSIPGELRATVAPVQGAVFMSWIGVPVETELGPGERVTFAVWAGDEKLAEQTIDAAGVGRWHSLRVDWPTSRVDVALRLESERLGQTGDEASAEDPPVLALWGAPRLVAPSEASGPDAIVVVVVDTLRADRLSLYGYDRPTSPYLDALARESAVFDAAYSESPWTVPSVASILTSREPWQLGTTWGGTLELPPEPVTLAEVLGGHGYLTAAFVANLVLVPDSGYARGFDRYEFERFGMGDGAELNDRVFRFLDEQKGDRVFLYVHYADPHEPYRMHDDILSELHPDADLERLRETTYPPKDREAAERLRLRYDGEVRYADRQIEALHRSLRQRFGDRVLLVVAADHGEEFLEHGFHGHATNLYDEQVHVPLLFHYPGAVPTARFDVPVRNLDLLPTVLDLAGFSPPDGLEGASLRPYFDGAVEAERLAHAETSSHGPRRHAVRDREFTYMTHEAYDTLSSKPLGLSEDVARRIESLPAQALYARGDEGGGDLQQRHPDVVERMQRALDRTELERHRGVGVVLRGALDRDAEPTRLSARLRVDRGRFKRARLHRGDADDRYSISHDRQSISIDIVLAPGDVDWIYLTLDDGAVVSPLVVEASSGPAPARLLGAADPGSSGASPDEILTLLDTHAPDRPVLALWQRDVGVRASEIDPEQLERLEALGYIEEE